MQTVRIFEEGKLIFNSEVCLENGIIGRSDTLMQEKIKSFMNAPWWSFTKSMSEYLNEELKKELSQKHLLYGKETVAIARREDNDDVIYWIDELNKYAVVHLTYSNNNSERFPKTQLFTLNELEQYCKEVSKYYEE